MAERVGFETIGNPLVALGAGVVVSESCHRQFTAIIGLFRCVRDIRG